MPNLCHGQNHREAEGPQHPFVLLEISKHPSLVVVPAQTPHVQVLLKDMRGEVKVSA